MKKLKSLWLILTGSISSFTPIIFACCKTGACVGVCVSPVASLFGLSTASIVGSPIVSFMEPLLIAISAVSFTISYYSLYVLPKILTGNTSTGCACGPTEEEKRKLRLSKSIFWIGLMSSIIFLSYFQYQKYKNYTAEPLNATSCSPDAGGNCCPEDDAE